MLDPIIKKKNDLMKSIMTNPKLSKQFREAISAPIGSTKREHAKSILSIMKKVGGLKHDGMGGPLTGMSLPTGLTSNNPSPVNAPNYSNLLVFPAAPKLKIPTIANQNSPLNITGSPTQSNTNSFTGLKPLDINTNKSTVLSNFSIKEPAGSGVDSGLKKGNTTVYTTPTKVVNTNISGTNNNPDYTALAPGQFSGPVQPETNSVKQLQIDLNKKNAGQAGWIPLKEDGVMGPKTQAAQSFVPGQTTQQNVTGTGTPTSTSNNSGTSTTPKSSPSGSNLISSAKQAVSQGTGPALFAMNAANEKFGGSLDKYVADLDAKLKTDFNLEPLEQELTNLKAMKSNLVPTLQSYITGKDQYLKFIDSMIDTTKEELMDVDMSDPASVDRYNNHMNYLDTLKGRQTQRYGNFLNSAISDYNADLELTQSNYENVYNRYNDAITRQGTLAQNEYNTLYQTMADLYTNLEQAPIRRANLEALQLQNEANRMTILSNGLGSGQTTNPDYWKDVKTYIENIADKDGNLSNETLGDGGLPGLFAKLSYAGGDPYAMAEAINTSMAKSLATGGLTKLQEFKGMINDLSSVEGGEQLASMLTPSLSKNSYSLVSDYVLNNLPQIKQATNQLVSGTAPWFSKNKKPGLVDKEGWMSDYKGIDRGILEDLYNTAKINITPGSSYEQNPGTFVSTLLSGADDKSIANNLTSSLMSF